jgi:hypothetical protein
MKVMVREFKSQNSVYEKLDIETKVDYDVPAHVFN